MWVHVQWVRDCVEIENPPAKLVLFALATYANKDNEAWPGMELLAAVTGFSERSVRRHIASLEEAGVIKRARRQRFGKRKADVIEIDMAWKPDGQGDLFCTLPDNLSGTGTGQIEQAYRTNQTGLPDNLSGSYKEERTKERTKKPQAPAGADVDVKDLIGGEYFVRYDVIALTKAEFKKWEREFPHLDLDEELEKFDKILADDPAGDRNVTRRTEGYLRERNAAARIRAEAPDYA